MQEDMIHDFLTGLLTFETQRVERLRLCMAVLARRRGNPYVRRSIVWRADGENGVAYISLDPATGAYIAAKGDSEVSEASPVGYPRLIQISHPSGGQFLALPDTN